MTYFDYNAIRLQGVRFPHDGPFQIFVNTLSAEELAKLKPGPITEYTPPSIIFHSNRFVQ